MTIQEARDSVRSRFRIKDWESPDGPKNLCAYEIKIPSRGKVLKAKGNKQSTSVENTAGFWVPALIWVD